jgi:hypothetical protein
VISQTTAPRPTIAASNLSFSNVEGNTLQITMTAGNGARRMIIAKAGSPVTAIPADGTTYTASTNFGNGQQIAPNEYVIANGIQLSMLVTNLQHGTTYYFAIFEY